jgi:small subunit ribosomal protein S16
MVKMRLARRGRKKLSLFDIVVSDARAPRDGKFIEKIGTYNPATNPASILIKEDRAFHWLMVGAQPSDTVRAMLSYKGIMYKRHLQIGVDKGALTQEAADSKLADWLNKKQASVESKVSNLAKSKEDAAKARKQAETKVKEARAEAIRKKAEVPVDAPAATAEPAPTEGEVATPEAQA